MYKPISKNISHATIADNVEDQKGVLYHLGSLALRLLLFPFGSFLGDFPSTSYCILRQ